MRKTSVATSSEVKKPHTKKLRPKLPNFKLPTFTGELTEYEEFIDYFQAQIGRRQDLEPVSKAPVS